MKSEFSENPIFCKSLMQNCIDHSIIGIKRHYDFDNLDRDILKYYPGSRIENLFYEAGDSISIELSNGLILDVNCYSYSIRLRKRLSFESRKFYSHSPRQVNKELALDNLKGYKELKNKLGQKIMSTYLLREQYSNIRLSNSPGLIGGFGFNLIDGSSISFSKGKLTLFKENRIEPLHGNNECQLSQDQIEIGPRDLHLNRNLVLDTDARLLKNGYYEKSLDFVEFDKEYNFMRPDHYKFKHLKYYVLQHISFEKIHCINISNLIKDSIIDARSINSNPYFKTLIDEHSIVGKIIKLKKSYQNFKFDDAITLIESLFTELKSKNVAIQEICFGLDDNYKFGLLSPFDIKPIYGSPELIENLEKLLLKLNEIKID